MIDVVFLPSQMDAGRLPGAQVVVLDILRATSTIVTALANRAKEVRLFADIESAVAAKGGVVGPVLLAGERGCVKVEGFDCGNSPAEYAVHKVGNATILLTTTNGTVAAVAAQAARRMLIGSLLNSAATAKALLKEINATDTLLVCAGTNGQVSCEDIIGAGAILFQIMQQTYNPSLPFTDRAWIAYHAFAGVRQKLGAALRLGAGGINLIEAGLEDDIDLCAQLDAVPVVVGLEREPLRAVRV